MTREDIIRMAEDAGFIWETDHPAIVALAELAYAAGAAAALRAATEKPLVKTYTGGKPNYTEPQDRKPVAWRKNYQNSGYTYFDERWGTIPDDAEPLFSN